MIDKNKNFKNYVVFKRQILKNKTIFIDYI